jgi:hypothetical protein
MLHFSHHIGIATGMKNWAFIIMLLAASPAFAQGEKPPGQSMIYDVYASGVHVLEARLDIREETGRYEMLFTAHTRGFLKSLLPWTGQYEVIGWADGAGGYHPEHYISKSVWKDELEGKEYRFTKDGGFQELLITKDGKTAKADVAPELSKGAIDEYTSALKVFAKIAREGACEGQDDNFDEKRRYTQLFKPLENAVITPTEYNAFAGEAVKCTVEVVPNGGKWRKKPRGWMNVQEQGRRLGQLPTMWAAKLTETGPAVPVKVLIKTDYGALVIHLAEYRNGDKILISGKRKD